MRTLVKVPLLWNNYFRNTNGIKELISIQTFRVITQPLRVLNEYEHEISRLEKLKEETPLYSDKQEIASRIAELKMFLGAAII